MAPLTPKRPYLLQAYFDWILDNNLTPYLLVNTQYPEVQVPEDFIQDNQIILNLSPAAVGSFVMNNKEVQFKARFHGKPRDIYIPLGAVLAIYARENSEGILFEDEEAYLNSEPGASLYESDKNTQSPSKEDQGKKGSSHLKIIK